MMSVGSHEKHGEQALKSHVRLRYEQLDFMTDYGTSVKSQEGLQNDHQES